MSVLTETVVHGGNVYAVGTQRSDAPDVPNGPWWSDAEQPDAEQSGGEQSGGEPPRAGKGSGAEAWREYAASIGVEHDEDATRDDIIAAVDAR